MEEAVVRSVPSAVCFWKLLHLPIMPFPTPEMTPDGVSQTHTVHEFWHIHTTRDQNVLHLAGTDIRKNRTCSAFSGFNQAGERAKVLRNLETLFHAFESCSRVVYAT